MEAKTTPERIAALRRALGDLGQDTRHLSDGELLGQALGRGARTVPDWADRDASLRIKVLREDYERQGEDVTGLSDVELLNRELGRTAAEANRHRSAFMLLLQDRTDHERSVRAAARRSAEGDRVAVAGLYLQAVVRKNAAPLDGVVHRAENLPEDGRASMAQVRELREAARQARWLLSGLASDKALKDARRDEGVQILEKLKAEVRRLRDFIDGQGRALHAARGDKSPRGNSRCACPGCELIRAVDDVPADEAA